MKHIIKIVFGLVVIIGLGFLLFQNTYSTEEDGSVTVSGFLVVEKIKEYPLRAMVTEPDRKIGIALEEYKLDYGYVPMYSNVTKYINVWNQGSPSKIHLEVIGNISEFIEFSDNDFVLKDGKEVSVLLYAVKTGNFSGILRVSAKKPRSRWLDWILPII